MTTKRTKKTTVQRRGVTISVRLPASVDIIVTRDSPYDDWQVEEVYAVSCETSPRDLMEHMREVDLDNMYARIAWAEDLDV